MGSPPNDFLALPRPSAWPHVWGGADPGVAGPAKSTIVRSLQEGRYGTFPRMGENEKEPLFPGRLGERGEDQAGIRSLGVSGCQSSHWWRSPRGIWKTWIQGNSQISPLPRSIVIPFLPRAACLRVGSQLGDRFLGDLERRPVLLWTAHSAAAAAAAVPGVCLAPPGGEWGAHRLLEHPARSGEAQPRKAPHSRQNLTPAPSSGPSEDGAGGSGCPRPGRETASGLARPGGQAPVPRLGAYRALPAGSLRSAALLAAPALLSRPPRF